MIKKLLKLIYDPQYRFVKLSEYGFYNNLSDEEFIKRKFRAELGYELNLQNPRTFNEKLQWLKLHDHNPIYPLMVDKYEVKRIVSERIGEKYIIPTYGVWNRFSEIDFDSLPNKFVLKCTHDSGGIVICKDKSSFNYKNAKRKIEKCLKRNFFLYGREWPYKNIKPRIIAEKYLESDDDNLPDYKFFCFNGIPKVMFIATDRQKNGEEVKFDFFDMNFNHLPIENGHPLASFPPDKPKNFDLMKELARLLSISIPQIRVDFYEMNGDVYFGELTFFQHSGFCPIKPLEWDIKMGDWIEINNNQ